MFSKSRLMTIGLGAVVTLAAFGYLKKSAAAAVKAGTKPEDTLAGKLGIV